jgi:hypothetical protein
MLELGTKNHGRSRLSNLSKQTNKVFRTKSWVEEEGRRDVTKGMDIRNYLRFEPGVGVLNTGD